MARNIPSAIETSLKSRFQTAAAKAQIEPVVYIRRPTTAVRIKEFIERSTLSVNGSPINASVCSATLRREKIAREPEEIYLASACIGAGESCGTVSVYKAATSSLLPLDAHIWADTGFTRADAVDVSIAFDGKYVRDARSMQEFITTGEPFVFYVTSAGALYARRMDAPYTDAASDAVLAHTGVTAVSAVRGSYSEADAFDMGLLVFFIMEGAIYYRAYKDGAWSDAEAIPELITPQPAWAKIMASRTWDYRVVVQATTAEGALYEIATQTYGIGTRGVERIDARIAATGRSTEVQYTDTASNERVSAAVSAQGQRIYALSSAMLSAANVDDGTGDMGKRVAVVFDYPITGAESQPGAFKLTDSLGSVYIAQTAATSADGKTLTLGFIDFNNAVGECAISYTPGTVMSPVAALAAQSVSFTPEGLVPTYIPLPEVTEIWNL